MNAARERLMRSVAKTNAAGDALFDALRPLRVRVREHRTVLLAGGGFAAGLAAAVVPLRWWSRLGRAAARAFANAVRSAPSSTERTVKNSGDSR